MCHNVKPLLLQLHLTFLIVLNEFLLLFRVQLGICVSNIVKHDFPGRWTQIVDKISIYLQNPDAAGWTGALMCLYQLVKNFE